MTIILPVTCSLDSQYSISHALINTTENIRKALNQKARNQAFLRAGEFCWN